ncbi:MAG: VCBS repeat-containing protein [Bacteroidia bacterium]|nr:VCBS repeat-containing protein [Bacteroidia bacterium]
MLTRIPVFALSFLILLSGCQKKNNGLFRLLSPNESGIDFNNQIVENKELNIINLEYLYNGGGVAVGDFNNDGLNDLFFTGNIVPNKLYLNQGKLKFKDISEYTGTGGENKWKSGVALVDINSDGWLDIYVCATILNDSNARANMLFVNQGLNDEGYPVFKDEAAAYGIDDRSYTSNAAFFDYDRDGDLDLYLLTNSKQHGVPIVYRPKVNDGTSTNTDKLFRNNGDGTFTNVSREAGILYEGYGLGIAIFDVNNDGWPDVYVGNDYLSNDLLYVNHQGKFSNEIDSMIRHQSRFSMGNDIADINNDGLQDIITLDMLPEKNLRQKTVISGPRYVSYINDQRLGYTHQFTRNMLQIGNENGTFSEVGQLAGVYQTEWSWSALFADFDNDGYRDLLITNGFPRDITDKDFINYRQETGSFADIEFLLSEIPSVKVPNYAFKNKGDLTFQDVGQSWGLTQPSFSNGAAFADLDNDGDLDYVVNNINDPVFVYENTLYPQKTKDTTAVHFLRIKLTGPEKNPFGLGTKITLKHGQNQIQFHEHNLYRGYISTVESIVHFGLGKDTQVDTLTVQWPDGKTQTLFNLEANQVLVCNYADAKTPDPNLTDSKFSQKRQNLLDDITAQLNVTYKQPDYDQVDFNIQRTIPHKFSQNGPGIAVADINGDGREDFCVGGFSGVSPTFFIQQADGKFAEKPMASGEEKLYLDEGLLFFDSDNDGDQDLYIASGGFQYPEKAKEYRHRFYRNDGKGNFRRDSLAIPDIRSSGSCVRASDFDQDGDLDIFVGGRIIPAKYPYPAESFLLRNTGGKFEDVAATLCPELKTAGMISDAIWSDVDGDNRIDLLVVGEFMPITVFKNEGNRFSRMSDTGLENYTGWWRSISGGDFDRDGDIDFIAGNLGRNNHYNVTPSRPLKVFADDFDNNQSVDAILACYFKMEDDSFRLCSVHFWEDLNAQSPKFRGRFDNFADFGRATMDSVLTPEEQKDALILEAKYLQTSYIENLSNGKFRVTPLSVKTQVAPVNGIVVADVNGDNYLDALLVGNDYGNELFSGTYDAFQSLVLLGKGDGTFVTAPFGANNVEKDAKGLARLSMAGKDIFIATQNKDYLKIFAPSAQSAFAEIVPEPLDTHAEISFADGKKMKVEFYYGSGYLSQSTRKIRLSPQTQKVVVWNSKGESREVVLPPSLAL